MRARRRQGARGGQGRRRLPDHGVTQPCRSGTGETKVPTRESNGIDDGRAASGPVGMDESSDVHRRVRGPPRGGAPSRRVRRGRRARASLYLDRGDVPDLEPAIRFELSTIGKIHDARDTVLVEVPREYRRVISYDEGAVHPPRRDSVRRGQELLRARDLWITKALEARPGRADRRDAGDASSGHDADSRRDRHRLRRAEAAWRGRLWHRGPRVTGASGAALGSARDTARPPSFDDGLPAGSRPGTPAVDTKVQ